MLPLPSPKCYWTFNILSQGWTFSEFLNISIRLKRVSEGVMMPGESVVVKIRKWNGRKQREREREREMACIIDITHTEWLNCPVSSSLQLLVSCSKNSWAVIYDVSWYQTFSSLFMSSWIKPKHFIFHNKIHTVWSIFLTTNQGFVQIYSAKSCKSN